MRRRVTEIFLTLMLSLFTLPAIATPDAAAAKADACSLLLNIPLLRIQAKSMERHAAELAVAAHAGSSLKQKGKDIALLQFLSERISANVVQMLDAEDIDPEIPFSLGRDAMYVRETMAAVEAQLAGLAPSVPGVNAGKERLGEMRKSYVRMERALSPLMSNFKKLKSSIKVCSA
jgi:hypothetical protein